MISIPCDRRAFSRVIFRLVALLILAGFMPGAALANAKYAAIVIDAETGKVIEQERANKKLYPASLVKMMTLYLTFEAVQKGRLDLDEKITVSRRVAAQPASKLGLRRGQKVSIRTLIRATAVKSANDAAVALAEAVAGSETAFARQMTDKARRLGMSRTVFRNASGLTDRKQKSTARDMAVLGRRLFLDYPAYYNLFSRRQISYGGRRLRNTNRLLGKYPGLDGIKTGYTSASGYNLVASARKGDRRLIAVVFGGRTSLRRNRQIEKMFDRAFKRLPERRPEGMIIASPLPRPRPAQGEILALAAAERPGRLRDVLRNAQAALSAQETRTPKKPRAVRTVLNRPASPGLNKRRPGTRLVSQSVADRAQGRSWAVQLGAFASKTQALDRLRDALRLGVPGSEKAARAITRATSGETTIYRARLIGFDRDSAHRACSSFTTGGLDCIAIPPQGWS